MPDTGTPVSPAIFAVRERCIACASTRSRELGSGYFRDDPLRSFIEGDAWGESPLPLIRDEMWQFVECVDCGQRRHRSIVSPEWTDVRFTKWMSGEAIREFEAAFGDNHDAARDVQHVLRLRDLGVRRVLDFGCGFGQFLEMCRLFGFDAHGVDKSSARREGAGVQIHASLEQVPGTFDAITMFEVLEHLDDPMAELLAIKERLNPGGVMIVEVPDTSGITTIDSPHSYRAIHPLDHINAFTPQSLVAFMGRAGLRPIRKEPAFVTTSVRRVVKDFAKAALKQKSIQRYFQAGAA